MFTLPSLPYNYNALEPYIDEATMKLHHDKHHRTYVENLNLALAGQNKLLEMPVEEIIKDIKQIPENIRTKVINHGGGHANHAFFWKTMSPNTQKPGGRLLDALNSTFDSFDKFQEGFTKIALSRFGSGWAWLVSTSGKLEIIDTPNQDSPLSIGKIPLLTIDIWEHAYYLQYQNRRIDYIKAWWNTVNWEEVQKRFNQVMT